MCRTEVFSARRTGQFPQLRTADVSRSRFRAARQASGIEAGGIELVGALRYLRQMEAADTSSGWDVGARLIWQIRNELALSGEIVKREWDSAINPDSYRASAVFEARLGASVYIFASFGRDYAEKGTRSTLVSPVGLNIGVGKKPLLTN
jgi:hypothetical protein